MTPYDQNMAFHYPGAQYIMDAANLEQHSMQARPIPTFGSEPMPGYAHAHNDSLKPYFNPPTPVLTNPPQTMRSRSTPFEDDDSSPGSGEEVDAEVDEDVHLPPPSSTKASKAAGRAPRVQKSTSPRLSTVAMRTSISKAPRPAASTSALAGNIVEVFKGGCAKARAMKSQIPMEASMAMPTSEPKGRRPVEQDPENHLIMDLRCNEAYAWGAIAKILNQERVKQGGEPTWTEPAVYSRFKRNAPKIAEMNGQPFDHKDYIHMKNEKKKAPSVLPLQYLTESAQVALLEAMKETQDNFWAHVADLMERKTGRKYDAQECSQWYKKI